MNDVKVLFAMVKNFDASKLLFFGKGHPKLCSACCNSKSIPCE